jgi:hypothetical protein
MPKQGLNKLEQVFYALGSLIFGLDGVPIDHRLRSRSDKPSSNVASEVARRTTKKQPLQRKTAR